MRERYGNEGEECRDDVLRVRKKRRRKGKERSSFVGQRRQEET